MRLELYSVQSHLFTLLEEVEEEEGEGGEVRLEQDHHLTVRSRGVEEEEEEEVVVRSRGNHHGTTAPL